MGIGRASALAFARKGAKVVVADVDLKGGEETVRLIKKAKGEAIFFRTDVSSAADVEGLVKKTVATYGKIDYAHNNAAINRGIGVMTADYKEDDWDIQVDVNLKGIPLHEVQKFRDAQNR
jgi:NAD(P)-dependent dehydrogenase (short-subunit alcohol dehydrogenase family)